MKKYLGSGGLKVLGFEQVAYNQFALFHRRRFGREEVGRVVLDEKGFIVEIKGFERYPRLQGVPILFLNPSRM